ncbi:MAG: hypothetical protein M3436_06655 [Pseudomonadota bacterium]|nr:hypothetical protein [Pseudomonadota bacterium]
MTRRKHRALQRGRLQVAMGYPSAGDRVEPGGPTFVGINGRRGMRRELWKRSRPPQAWQAGCGQGGSSISGTVRPSNSRLSGTAALRLRLCPHQLDSGLAPE